MKRLFVVVCALIVSLTWAVPAQAAPATRTPPSAPTAVTAVAGPTAAQALLAWSSPAAAGSHAVYGYTIVKEGAGARTVYWQKADRAAGVGYSRTFTTPAVGATYTFTLKAWSLAGSSPAATASYTPAATPTSATVFSVDTATRSLISVPAAGGTPKVLVSGADIAGLVADGSGNVFYADRTAHTVVKVAAGTGAVTTLASGLTTTRKVVVDAAGSVYYLDGPSVHKITAGGQKSVVYTGSTDLWDLAVTPAGQLFVDSGAFDTSDVTLVTISPAGVAASRVLSCGDYGYCSDLMVDSRGVLWVLIVATGASGYSEWYRLPVGATKPVDLIQARTAYYSVGLDAANTFYVAATKTFCPSISQNNGGCTPDLTSTEILRITAAGTFNSTLKVSGLTVAPGGSDIAVGGSGSLVVAAANGLLKYAATGGAPTVLATGSFDQVVVVG